MLSLSEKAEKQITSIAKNPQQNVGEAFAIMNEHRKEVDSFMKKYFNEGGMPLTGTAGYTNDVAKGLRANLKDVLNDEAAFGVLGTTNKSINKAVSEFITAQKNFIPKFGTKVLENGQKKWVVDPAKIGSFLNNPEAARNAIRNNFFEDYFSKIDNLLKVSKEKNLAGFMDSLPAETRALLDNAQQMKASLAEMRSAAIGLQALQSKTGARLSGALIGGMIGTAVGGPVGTALGGAIGHALNSPLTTFKVLTKMERAIINNQTATAEKLNRCNHTPPRPVNLTIFAQYFQRYQALQ